MTWYDTIYFCNKLSEKLGLTPVYSSGRTTDVTWWKWSRGDLLYDIEVNLNADGFRLPTSSEWEHAARGGDNYKYAGSDTITEVGWSGERSGSSHPVKQKKPNGYGLYDMSGNVWEWLADIGSYSSERYYRGGCWNYYDSACEISASINEFPSNASDDVLGFRVVRKIEEVEW